MEEDKDWQEALEELESSNEKIGGKFTSEIEELKKNEENDWQALKKLISEIDHLKKEEMPEDFKDKYLRTLAELENVRKRMQKEKQESLRFAIDNAVSEFLPVIDNFENALKFASSASEELKNWASGFQMILSQFKEVLHNHGVVAFHSVGNKFDPHFHEAVEIVESDTSEDGIILEEFAKGYKSAFRTIRPAQVKVSRKVQSTQEDLDLKQKENEHVQ
ncbi:MAG: nucleotide exchange factor GrpE [Chlamydiae bacterium CG10_big_fil_rev_8_21_14_0_10_35_9]|nr:MAG: nucleotide exchange factor GrpE [Chlamydiae bacterium CG10_big_fil_rev_8_21_14_0_10_35_9]